MARNDVRAAIVQQQSNRDLTAIGVAGLTALAITAGVWWQSWLIGIATLLLPIILLAIPGAMTAVTLLLAALWAFVGFQIGTWLGGSWNFGLAGILGLFGFGAYTAMGTVLEDLGGGNERVEKQASTKQDGIRSVFTQEPNQDQIPRGAWMGAGLMLALSIVGFGVVFNSTSSSRHQAPEQSTSISTAETEELIQETLANQASEVAAPLILRNTEPPKQRRTSVDESNITVREWHQATESSRYFMAKAWTLRYQPHMWDLKGPAFVKVYSTELVKCVDESSRNLSELDQMLAAELAVMCVALLEY